LAAGVGIHETAAPAQARMARRAKAELGIPATAQPVRSARCMELLFPAASEFAMSLRKAQAILCGNLVSAIVTSAGESYRAA
jgi:hypothetical protein